LFKGVFRSPTIHHMRSGPNAGFDESWLSGDQEKNAHSMANATAAAP